MLKGIKMRISVNELIEPCEIKLSYFLKVLGDCKVSNRIYLDEFDLLKLNDCLTVRTYKTEQLLQRVKDVLVSEGC